MSKSVPDVSDGSTADDEPELDVPWKVLSVTCVYSEDGVRVWGGTSARSRRELLFSSIMSGTQRLSVWVLIKSVQRSRPFAVTYSPESQKS